MQDSCRSRAGIRAPLTLTLTPAPWALGTPRRVSALPGGAPLTLTPNPSKVSAPSSGGTPLTLTPPKVSAQPGGTLHALTPPQSKRAPWGSPGYPYPPQGKRTLGAWPRTQEINWLSLNMYPPNEVERIEWTLGSLGLGPA